MRIVSQDRLNDLNYGNIQLMYQKRDGDHIVSVILGYFIEGERWMEIGKYESKLRCIKVMENIRNAYACDKKVFLMPEE